MTGPRRALRSSRIPRAVLVRRWALVIGCALALVIGIVLPIALHAHRPETRAAQAAALTQCQQEAKSYADLLAGLERSAGAGQSDLAAGTGEPATVAAYRALYASAKDAKQGECAASASAATLRTRASAYASARSSLQKKMDAAADAAASAACAGGASASPSTCASASASSSAQAFDWVSPSGGTQPELSGYQELSVHVSLADQRVYVMSGSTVIYTMICSSGTGDATPTGSFQVQNRGTTFFNGSEGMGANYWVSWKNWGEYLFHSVPIDENGNYIASEALKLGHKASTGCIRLTVDDAKWLYEELPENTTVTIS